jgi:hypothetical protein
MMTIKLQAEREDISPARLAKHHGYVEGFAAAVAKVRKEAVGRWGWCSVKLTVTLKRDSKTITGTSYLGGCSYYNELDFIENSGYFDSMLADAVAEARQKLSRLEEAKQ